MTNRNLLLRIIAFWGLALNMLSLVLVLPSLAQASELISYRKLDESKSSGSHTVNPMGMTDDPFTGLIEWTPTVTGSFDVTVKALNTEGVHT